MKSKINALIAIYEIIGGIAGLYILIVKNGVINLGSYPIIVMIIIVFAVSLNVLSVISGFRLWREKENGLFLSIIVQAFQVPYIITASFVYCVASGLRIIAGIAFSYDFFRVSLSCDLIPYFNIYYGNVVKYDVIAINILPIIIILHIRKMQRIAKYNQLETEIENEVVSDTDTIS